MHNSPEHVGLLILASCSASKLFFNLINSTLIYKTHTFA